MKRPSLYSCLFALSRFVCFFPFSGWSNSKISTHMAQDVPPEIILIDNHGRNGDRQKTITPCLNAYPCQDRARPRLVGVAAAACYELTDVCRLVVDAYGGAAEFCNDERDALRANQAHNKAKAVCLPVLLICFN